MQISLQNKNIYIRLKNKKKAVSVLDAVCGAKISPEKEKDS
jgi:hypothetical protein